MMKQAESHDPVDGPVPELCAKDAPQQSTLRF